MFDLLRMWWVRVLDVSCFGQKEATDQALKVVVIDGGDA